jgi:hypothetical protein
MISKSLIIGFPKRKRVVFNRTPATTGPLQATAGRYRYRLRATHGAGNSGVNPGLTRSGMGDD